MAERVYDCKCISHYPVGEMGWITCVYERRFIARSTVQAEKWAEAEARVYCGGEGRVACECYDLG